MGLARYRSVLSKVVTFSLSKSPRTGLGLALALSMAPDRLIRREVGALLLLADALCLKAVFSSLHEYGDPRMVGRGTRRSLHRERGVRIATEISQAAHRAAPTRPG